MGDRHLCLLNSTSARSASSELSPF